MTINQNDLQKLLTNFANSITEFITGNYDDEINKINIPELKLYYTFDDYYNITISLFDGTSNRTFTTGEFNPVPLVNLENYLKERNPNVKFSSACFDAFGDEVILVFKSDPESFKAFINGIQLSNVRLEREDREPEKPDERKASEGEDR